MMKVNNLDKSNLICIATIGKARGLKGEFFINSFCDPRENIINYSNFIIEDNVIPNFEISFIKKANSKLYSKIIGIDDVDEIKSHTNKKIYIHKKDLPKLGHDEIYWHDLLGLKVLDNDTQDVLGIISNIYNYGSNDCLEVLPTKDSVDELKRLIHFVKNKIIKNINKEDKKIYVDWDKSF